MMMDVPAGACVLVSKDFNNTTSTKWSLSSVEKRKHIPPGVWPPSWSAGNNIKSILSQTQSRRQSRLFRQPTSRISCALFSEFETWKKEGTNRSHHRMPARIRFCWSWLEKENQKQRHFFPTVFLFKAVYFWKKDARQSGWLFGVGGFHRNEAAIFVFGPKTQVLQKLLWCSSEHNNNAVAAKFSLPLTTQRNAFCFCFGGFPALFGALLSPWSNTRADSLCCIAGFCSSVRSIIIRMPKNTFALVYCDRACMQ